MALQHIDLNPIIRLLMIDELKIDISANKLYQGKRLTSFGLQDWSSALFSSFDLGSDATFETWLSQPGRLETTEQYTSNGVLRTRKVPSTAARTFAEGEFNRFYIRAVCRQAMNTGSGIVTAYRARHSENPRPESIAVVGKQFSAQAILADLRENTSSDGVNTVLGLPPGPNSGISVRL